MRTRAHRLKLIALGVTTVLVVGCGGGQPIRELPPTVLEYTTNAVEHYSDDVQVDPQLRKRFAKLARKFKGGLDKKYHALFRHDPRLDGVAWLNAYAWAEHDIQPAEALTRWAMWKAGIYGRVHAEPAWWWEGDYGSRNLPSLLAKYAAKLKKLEGKRYLFGVARLRVPPQRFAMGMVIVEQPALLDALPKRHLPGAPLLIRGKVLVPHRGVDFHMNLGGQDDLSMPVHTNKDGKFLIKVPAPETPGRHMISLKVWRKNLSPLSAFELPLYIAVDEPPKIDPRLLAPQSNPPHIEDWAARTLKVYNEARTARDLPRLRWDEQAAAVAQGEAVREAERPFSRMVYPPRLLENAGIRTARSDWKYRRFYLLEELLGEMMLAPSLRDALFDDRYSGLGIGFARDKLSENERYLMVQYLFGPEAERIAFSREVQAAFDNPAPRYAEPLADPPPEAQSAELDFAAQLEQQLGPATLARVRHDPRLDTIALAYAQRGRIEGRIERWMLEKVGVIGEIDQYFRRVTRERRVTPHVVAQISNWANYDEDNRKQLFRFGVAHLPGGAGRLLETIIVVSKEMEFEPLPKRHAPGEPLVIRGRYLGEVRRPMLYMTLPRDQATEMDLEVGSDGYFIAKLVTPEQPGRYTLEFTTSPVRVRDKQIEFFTHTTAAFTIHVDQPEDTRLGELAENNPTEIEDVADWTDYVREQYDAARQAQGIAAVRRNALAEALLADYAYRDELSWDVSAWHALPDKLEQNGGGELMLLRARRVDSIERTARQHLASPVWRQAIIDETTTMIGNYVHEQTETYLEALVADCTSCRPDEPDPDHSKTTADLPVAPKFPRLGRLASAVIAETVRAQMKKINKCYRTDGLVIEEDLAGRLTVKYVIGVDGRVIAVYPTASTLEFVPLELCVVEAMREWKFPPPIPGPHGRGVVFAEQQFEFKPIGKNGVVSLR